MMLILTEKFRNYIATSWTIIFVNKQFLSYKSCSLVVVFKNVRTKVEEKTRSCTSIVQSHAVSGIGSIKLA